MTKVEETTYTAMNKLTTEFASIASLVSTQWILLIGAIVGSLIGWALAILTHLKPKKRPSN